MAQGSYLVRAVSLRVLALASVIALGACNTTYLEQRTDQPQNAADIMRSTDLQPRRPQPTGAVDTGGANTAKPFSFFGSPAATAPASAPAPGSGELEAAGGGYTLNFEDTPVANVAKSVLGDVLGVSYVVDPHAQGSITLSSGRPIAKKDMLFVLEDALHANNLNMVRDGSGYKIVPANDVVVGAVDRAGGPGSVEPGFGVTVIPVQYVSGTTLSKLLEGFASRPGAIRTDPTGKLLIVLGTGSERQAALDTVRSFDVDWLQGQSVGMYPVKNSTPEPVVGELEKIMDTGESGLGHGLVKFEAVGRLNAILVVASKPDLLRAAARWISRLDEPSAASASVKVYKVRYGEAKQIAGMLSQIFTAGAGSEAPTNEIAPSSGAKAMTTTQRLTGGKPPDSNTPTPVSAGAGAGSKGRGAAGQSGGGPVATLNAELSSLGFGQGGAGGPQMPNVRITADAVNNSVLIYANDDEYKTIERTLNQLDRPKLQVAIEVTLAEVTLNQELNYGVQYFLHSGALSNTLNGQIPSVVNNYSSSPSGPPLTGGLNVIVGNGVLPRVVINALHNLTDVKILSNPSLVVVDNGEATLEVGDQVPISTGSATVLSANNAVVNTVDYKNTGIILHVQPRVNSNGSVLLDIDQEISAVQNPGNTNNPNLTPTITVRKVASEISVVSGQTVLLAGLIQDQQQQGREGIPMLNQIPFVGAALGTTGTSQVRTELIIFIRPQIIRDGADASMVAEELRAKMRGGKVQAVTPAALNVLARPLQ